ncbi:ABC transporter permease subunit [Paenibacillus sp.]|jgi:putative aldouronate transport system permease protein|uniref:ABC transporter permease n=1 Tax=Paenibacillus sp. TaxID=58172 RepID=UPI002831A9AF|nr:ABC transporter permease subunit [Paenibacillus sp.]MDR0271678.1 ABC transporter permease subunit [Paenibacillus sp.]
MPQTVQISPHPVNKTQTQGKSWIRRLGDQYQLVLLSIPFVLLVILFNYVPLWGWLAAFQDYKPYKGVTGSEFVGLANFKALFEDPHFLIVLRNTLVMSGMSIVTSFVGAISLALLLNEVQAIWFKRVVQTVTYIPHFVSMVVIANIVLLFLSPDGGFINSLLMNLGWIDKPIYFMGKGEWFWIINTLTGLWKELGWSTIIYLAVLSGINSELYEAAAVDGAGRFRKMLHISLPGLMPTATLLLIMSVGSLINTGYESQMLLGNPLVIDYSEVLDLYALSVSFGSGDYSVGVALSMFKCLVSVILVVTVNHIARKLSDTRLF